MNPFHAIQMPLGKSTQPSRFSWRKLGILLFLGFTVPAGVSGEDAGSRSLPAAQEFSEPLPVGETRILHANFPSKGESILTIRDGPHLEIRISLKSVTVKSGDAGKAQKAAIDGKIVQVEETKAAAKDLEGGCLRIGIASNDPTKPPKERKTIWYPAQPYFVRPLPAHYTGGARESLLRDWDGLPGLSDRGVEMRLERTADKMRIWLDDRFLAQIPMTGDSVLSGSPPEGAQWNLREGPPPASGIFQPIPLRGYVDEKRDPSVRIEILPEAAERIARLFPELPAGRAIDLGRARWLQDADFPLKAKEEFAPTYFSRRALDRSPENIILGVPNTDYRSARLLCAPLPGHKPVLTLRLTHFADNVGGLPGVGDAIVDREIVLEKKDGKWPSGCEEVGVMRLRDGTQAPLLLVDAPLSTGDIPDLVDAEGLHGRRSTQYLDLEITKGIRTIDSHNHALHAKFPVGQPSGIQLLGVALEQAPRIRLEPRRVGNAYWPDENPGWDLTISNAPRNFRGVLEWERQDIDGALESGHLPIVLPPGESSARIPLDFRLEKGWHGFHFRLMDSEGRPDPLWERRTSLVQLPAGTRKAGFESPFATWWFRETHGGTKDLTIVGPLYRKLGMRHVNPFLGPGPDGASLEAEGLRLNMLPKANLGTEKGRQRADDFLAKHPNVTWAMIFHEDRLDGDYVFPPEFSGRGIPPLTEAQRAQVSDKIAQARQAAEFYRERRPDIRLIVGNGAFPFAMTLMQNGFPKDCVDVWGDETPGQTLLPETQPTTSTNTLFWLAKYSKKYGYNAPVTTCYEWVCRVTSPGALTPLEQARFYCRDALHALAYKAPHINTGLLYDVSNSYYYSRWGACGLMTRFPLLDPKPSFVALATLTQELDGAEFQRVLPTDSPTTYALEFERTGERIYVLWIPRGERVAHLQFEGNAPLSATDMVGRPIALTPQQGSLKLTLSGSPLYLRSKDRIVGVRSEPTRLENPPTPLRALDPIEDATRWTLAAEGDPAFENAQFDFVRKLGDFRLSEVQDTDQGKALRLTLQSDPKTPWPVVRYAILKPAEPIALDENTDAIGLRVRGNSSWGRIFFELEDATGTRLLSAGGKEDGWSVNDWKGEHLVNFDGWNFLSVRLPGWYDQSYPMPQNSDWNISASPLTPPFKLTRILVEMRERVVRVNEVVEIPNLSLDLANLATTPRDP